MTKERATELLNTYGQAWITQDPDLIVTIFTPDAVYHEPHEPKNSGHDEIRSYWIKKVVGEQKDISFELLNVWLTGDTVIAEWYAEFTDTKRNLRIKINEVAICIVKDDKFESIREYYKTEKIPIKN